MSFLPSALSFFDGVEVTLTSSKADRELHADNLSITTQNAASDELLNHNCVLVHLG